MFALIIGINSYPNATKLKGAVNDACTFHKYLVDCLHVPIGNIKLLLDEEATKANIIQGLRAFQKNPKINYGDPIVVYFAGHGAEANSPPEWDSGKIQLILPHNYALDPFELEGGHERDNVITHATQPNRVLRNVIADRIFGALLNDICRDKGDNITVIFDCCHSGSGTREFGSNNVLVRAEEIPLNAVFDPNVDEEDSSSHYRIMSFCPGFCDKGIRSHMLLAACSESELAREENGQGNFTSALLDLLRTSNAFDLTYACLLQRIRKIDRQNPQCEGHNRNRTLFNLGVPPTTPVWYSIVKEKDKYKLHAGAINGVAMGDEFTIYDDRTFSAERFVLQVQQPWWITDFETDFPDQLNSANTLLSSYPVAVRTQNGQEVELRLLDDRCEEIFKGIQHPGVRLVRENIQPVLFGLSSNEQDQVSLRLLCPEALEHNLPQLSYAAISRVDELPSMLHAAAHYHRCFKYVGKDSYTALNVSIEFKKADTRELPLEKGITLAEAKATGQNLILNGIVQITPKNEDRYTLTVTNKSDRDLALNVLYFDHMDLSISPMFTPNRAGIFKADATLKAQGGKITVGDGGGGGPPFRFTFPSKRDLEIGFLKVFLTSKNVDLSDLRQDSIFDKLRKLEVDSDTVGSEIAVTQIFRIVQHRPTAFPSSHTSQ
ncbi:hypothetical protein M422DRAFT_239546 [Sphaerobolus stellatus SS14]|nr:hypothetical protein M422DRAFT_239546 [Sphaerobolus stellatus SS14]